MPNLITHHLFGEEILKNTPSLLREIITSYPKEFALGCQGPDFFFYYNAWPWMNQKKAKKVAAMGGSIHKRLVESFFSALLEQISQGITIPLSEECKGSAIPKNFLPHAKISYLAGLLCHWALDTTAHPYVFYQTGEISTKEGSINHHRFESHLDYLILKELRESPLAEYPGYKLIQYDPLTVHAMFDLYAEPLRAIHGYTLFRAQIQRSLKHFRAIQKALFDPKGRKFRLFYWIEQRILRVPYLFTSMITLPLEDSYDILNASHRGWQHPCTGVESNASFMELFYKALSLGSGALVHLERYLGEGNPEPLIAVIQDKSFETGLSGEVPMAYFNPVYPRG